MECKCDVYVKTIYTTAKETNGLLRKEDDVITGNTHLWKGLSELIYARKVMEFTKLTFWYVRARKDSCQYLAKLLWVDANWYHIWYCVLIWFLYCKVSSFGKPVVAHWLKSDSWHLTRGILCTEFGGHWINFSPNFEFRELSWPISCWLFTSWTRGGRLNEESFISSQNISLHFKNEKGRITPNVYLPMIMFSNHSRWCLHTVALQRFKKTVRPYWLSISTCQILPP